MPAPLIDASSAVVQKLMRTQSQFALSVPHGGLRLGSKRFYFLRHGQTQCNAMRIFQGADEPLNDMGFNQARDAALVLQCSKITRIVCSDLVRTMQTAAVMSRTHGLQLEAAQGLRERHFGAWIGTSSVDIDWALTPLGGESLEDFVTRICNSLSAILDTEDTTLIVAHGGTLHVLMAALQIESNAAIFANASPLRFETKPNGWRVDQLNMTDRLSGLPGDSIASSSMNLS